MLAIVIVALARARPMVRTISPMRSFWLPKTCSTFERTADLRPLALEYLTVQRAFVSFCAAFAGLSGQISCAVLPALMAAFPSVSLGVRMA